MSCHDLQAKAVVVADTGPTGERIAAALSAANYDVLLAADDRELLSFVQSRVVYAVVVDAKLDRNGGLSVVGKLRELEPKLLVIVISAFGSVASALTVVQRGATAYLPKPVSAAQVLDVLMTDRANGLCDEQHGWMPLRAAKDSYIDEVIAECGAISSAARALGLDRRSLRRMLARHGE